MKARLPVIEEILPLVARNNLKNYILNLYTCRLNECYY